MKHLTYGMIFLSLTLSAAMFGFFYAWVCSTMWGLDAADPRVAIGAMQAMNASVRNPVFAPAFFGTPLALGATAGLLLMRQHRRSAAVFAVGALAYLCFGLLLTMMVNVPMNEGLAVVAVPADVDSAEAIWRAYSGSWQVWNQIRTVASGAAFLLALSGVMMVGREGV